MKNIAVVLLTLLVLIVWPVLVLSASIDVNVTASPLVLPPTVNATATTNITNTAAILHGNITDTGGDNATCRGFEWGLTTGNYTHSWNETGNFTLGEYTHTESALPFKTQIFWIAFAINSAGRGNSSELNFTTLGVPFAPTNFTATQTGTSSANLTWTMGSNATRTIIRSGTEGYPQSVTEGFPVYNGTGTYVEVSGLNLDTTTYYYSAWGENDEGDSLEHAQTQIGGNMNTSMIIGLIGLGAMIAGFVLRRVPLMICAGMVWVAFGALMYTSSSDTSMGVGLFLIGLSFALTCFLYPLVVFIGGRRKRPNAMQRDYEDYKQQVLKATHREEL